MCNPNRFPKKISQFTLAQFNEWEEKMRAEDEARIKRFNSAEKYGVADSLSLDTGGAQLASQRMVARDAKKAKRTG
jgi:hypothetical protein